LYFRLSLCKGYGFCFYQADGQRSRCVVPRYAHRYSHVDGPRLTSAKQREPGSCRPCMDRLPGSSNPPCYCATWTALQHGGYWDHSPYLPMLGRLPMPAYVVLAVHVVSHATWLSGHNATVHITMHRCIRLYTGNIQHQYVYICLQVLTAVLGSVQQATMSQGTN
jgi:hypothetical protein